MTVKFWTLFVRPWRSLMMLGGQKRPERSRPDLSRPLFPSGETFYVRDLSSYVDGRHTDDRLAEALADVFRWTGQIEIPRPTRFMSSSDDNGDSFAWSWAKDRFVLRSHADGSVTWRFGSEGGEHPCEPLKMIECFRRLSK